MKENGEHSNPVPLQYAIPARGDDTNEAFEIIWKQKKTKGITVRNEVLHPSKQVNSVKQARNFGAIIESQTNVLCKFVVRVN